MVLKPSPRTAVLVQERVREALADGRVSETEKIALAEFDQELDHYLE